jgi:acylphosphatase
VVRKTLFSIEDYTTKIGVSSRFYAFCEGKKGYSEEQVYAMMVGMNQNEGTRDQPEQIELYAVVRGRVQGVGFRYFVVQKARELGLHGYARNESDGSVEVVAQGSRVALERLLIHLQRGPSAAEVEAVDSTWRERTEHIGGFHVRW